MEMTLSFIATIASMIGDSCSFEYCRYRQEITSSAIIISSVFADRGGEAQWDFFLRQRLLSSGVYLREVYVIIALMAAYQVLFSWEKLGTYQPMP